MSYYYDPQRADAAGELLANSSTTMERTIEALEAAINQYLQQVEGATVDNYQVAQTQWSNGFTELQQAMIQAMTAFQAVGDNYVTTDLNGAAAFAGQFH